MPQVIILGGPGTGKSTTLINIVEKHLEDGVRPDRVLYTTFTRKGANEALVRSCEKFKFNRHQLPYFRTLHSLAFHELKLSKEDVIGHRDFKKIGAALGLDFGHITFEDGMINPTQNKGDNMLYIMGLAKSKMISYEEAFKDCDFNFDFFEFKRFIDTLKEYKEKNGLLDFSDMISLYIESGKTLDIDVAIVDEAQDLSKQQWMMVRQATRNCEQIYVGGDDDQCIHQWSGADVKEFLTLKGERQILKLSHRLPKSIFQLANSITGRIGVRYEKKWAPRKEEGSIDYLNSVRDIQIRDGSNLFLVRNKYFLKMYEEFLQREGMPYISGRGSSIDMDSIKAIKTWELLRKGAAVNVDLIRHAYKFLKSSVGVRRGFKLLKNATGDLTMDDLVRDWGLMTTSIWHEALTEMDNLEYYLAVLRRGEKLDREPRVVLSTIHAVKGGEADHVVILSDVSWKTFTSYRGDPDTEHRVFYVGVTRARKTLQIILPQSRIFYDFPNVQHSKILLDIVE